MRFIKPHSTIATDKGVKHTRLTLKGNPKDAGENAWLANRHCKLPLLLQNQIARILTSDAHKHATAVREAKSYASSLILVLIGPSPFHLVVPTTRVGLYAL